MNLSLCQKVMQKRGSNVKNAFFVVVVVVEKNCCMVMVKTLYVHEMMGKCMFMK